jgi:para-nitrobenzyl esterase
MTIAETPWGRARGAEVAGGAIAWRGIPYARPPVGELRLRPPQPPARWAGTRDATRPGPRSLQPPAPLPVPGPPDGEDCLTLSVTAPAAALPAPGRAPGRGRPVLVWLHGGGYESGSGAEAPGDGAAFAAGHGVVVVTVNYRLGALGFLAVPGESPTGAHGLHDQVAALRWVRDAIAGFGGDPARVTVYGLSAGGKSVTALLASPLARGLFARAASSSGGDHVATPAQAAALAARFFAALGASPARIRDVPAADILAAQVEAAPPPRSSWAWRPMIDGAVLARAPLAAIAGGAGAGVPLLAQTCARECALFEAAVPGIAAEAGRVLAGYFGAARRDALLAAYAAAGPGRGPAARDVAVMTDERYVIRAGRLADAQAAHAPVWRSVYDGPYTGMPGPGEPGHALAAELAAGHGADQAGIWHGGPGLAGALHAAWGAFAAGGDPGWPRYEPPGRLTMAFGPGAPRVERDPLAAGRAAWDGLDWQPGTWSDLGGL